MRPAQRQKKTAPQGIHPAAPKNGQNKTPAVANRRCLFSLCYALQSAGNLTRAQATSACINILGRTIDNCLNALDVGLPGTVAATMRVGDLDTESHAFTTAGTFGHICCTSSYNDEQSINHQLSYFTRLRRKMQGLLQEIFCFFPAVRASPCLMTKNTV